MNPTAPHTSVPGLDERAAAKLIGVLEDRLVGSIDLQLVLKHIHWNVLGANFIAVHEMLDDQTDQVREMSDDIAERIATLGGVPDGNSGNVVRRRTWGDYRLGRADAIEHLIALDRVYDGMIVDNRKAIEASGALDPMTEDMLIGQTRTLEKLQWFVRSFHERAA